MESKNITWKHAAEALGILGIIGSLLIVSLEIRQNTNAVRSATIQAIAELSYDASMRFIENEEVMNAFTALRNGEIDEHQRYIIRNFYAAVLTIQQIRFSQVELGILEVEQAINMGGRSGVYGMEIFEQIWPELKGRYSEGFQSYIETHIIPLDYD